ncbi:MAG: hypothetical protein OEL88_09035 [Sterolibacteriaceae bacterium MAG5]|nr:hypothetical protein [Candidatus Nitricoxidireducens bremensis]
MTSPVFDPGSLHVRLQWRGGRCVGVRVELRRPNAAAVLRGKPAAEAVRLLPLLYSICGKAQGLAAALALRAARGETAAPQVDAAVRAEGVREHLWRLLLDWPLALGQPRAEALMAAAVRRIGAPDFAAWLAPALADHCGQLVAALPAGLGGLRSRLAEALQARQRDLLVGAELGQGEGLPLAPGRGRATVRTARGALEHELRLAGDDTLADLVIRAPTDRHFADAKLLESWLAGYEAATVADLHAAAQLVLLALDPCVPWVVAVDDDLWHR